LRAAGVPDVISESGSTRSVKVSVNTGNHELQYYESGVPRNRANSLQLAVRSSDDCYLTVASVNSMGDVYLLLPNSGQELSGFLSKGRIAANVPVLIPDSLADDNLAGFHFDYSPPGGIDRIIGICFANFSDAERLRAQLAKLELGGTLDANLFKVGTRGITDITPGLTASSSTPGQQAADQPSSGPDPGNGAQVAGWAAARLTLVVGSE
jgi:hypothetical protein